MSEVVSKDIGEKDAITNISVYDAEGKVYRKYTKRTYDPKYQTYEIRK
jgi:hypothetical protein